MSFGNQGRRVWRKSREAQSPRCLKSNVKFPQSVMIWGAVSSAGVGLRCFLKSTVNTAIYHGYHLSWRASKLLNLVKRKMRDTRPKNVDDLKATIKATGASITPQQYHCLIASMPRHIHAVIHAKGDITKYWVYRKTYFSEAWYFCLKYPFLIDLM